MGFHFRFRRGRVGQAGRRQPCGYPVQIPPAIIPLNQVPPNSVVKVCRLDGRGRLVRRLSEMGFIPGTVVRVLRRAPFKDPVEYQLRGYLVSLRREEAALVQVQMVEQPPIPNDEASDDGIKTPQEPPPV